MQAPTGRRAGGRARRMRVLLLNANRRGVGTYHRAIAFARELARRLDAEATLVTVSPTARIRVREERIGAVRVIEAPCLGDRALPSFGWGPLDVGLRLAEVARRYDVVYGFEHFLDVQAPLALARRLGAATISDWCDWHAGAANHFRGSRLLHRIDAHFEHAARRRVGAVTVISRALRDRALAAGVDPARVFVVREGTDLAHFRPIDRAEARARLGLPTDRPALLAMHGAFVGRAVEAFARVRREVPGALLLLVGWRMDEALARAAALGVPTSDLVTPGRVSDAELPLWLAAANVLTLPLADAVVDRARWPHKVGDFLAAGRAAVIQDVGDVVELFRDDGEIGAVASQDPEDYAACVARFLADPTRADAAGRRGREVAERKLSWGVVGDDLERAVRCALAAR